MAQQVSMVRKSLILSLVVGMVVGMGNGSVFGIYLMANLGRGNFCRASTSPACVSTMHPPTATV